MSTRFVVWINKRVVIFSYIVRKCIEYGQGWQVSGIVVSLVQLISIFSFIRRYKARR